MKTNGKNLMMFSYETHDYMDEQPQVNFRTAESKEVMDQFINHMRKYWASGTVSNAHEVTPYEYYLARQSAYWKGYERALDSLAEDCTEKWLEEYEYYLTAEEAADNYLASQGLI